MSNSEVAKLLRNVASALTIKNENRFRIIAYENAANSIENLTSDIKDIWKEGKLKEIPGIGPTITGYIEELLKKGKVKHFEAILQKISPAVFIFLEIPGIGPKKAYTLSQIFKIESANKAIERLENEAKSGKIAQLPGWGEKSQSELLNNIEIYKKGQIKENRMPLAFADKIAHELIAYLQKIKGVKQVDVLGSLRRKVATIGDIDLAVATTDPEAVIKSFVAYPKAQEVVDRGEKGATIRLKIGRQVDLRVQTPQAYGAMLQYFTGSKQHNIALREYALKKGMSLSEYGIKLLSQKSKVKKQNFNKKLRIYEFAKEEEFYKALGFEWIPPELREDKGEIEASIKNHLPQLVELSDIKGDFHIHSNFNLEPSHDLGVSSLKEILNTANLLNYDYLGISDHNPSLSNHNDKQIIDLVKRRRERFEQILYSWNNYVKKRIHLLIMMEVDIDPQGNLALPKPVFDYLDSVIVSVHSAFNMNKDEMTHRILTGLSHPKAKILGHPTGRLIGSRPGYDADWLKIFKFCVANNKSLEINAWPQRLDLPDMWVKEAVKLGAKLSINTDSHEKSQMFNMEYGVNVARRGWAQKKDIINTMEYNKLINWIRK